MARLTSAGTEPLMFPSRKASAVDAEEVYEYVVRGFQGSIECMLCSRVEENSRDAILKHFVEDHRLVIADVPQIADLAAYAQYWRRRLQGGDLTLGDIAAAIDTGPMPVADGEQAPVRYYMLSDILPEDRGLRERLAHERLGRLLAVQHKERACTQPWPCLFCKEAPMISRDALFTHMLDAHQFNVGHPDNLVFVRQYLASLQTVLDECRCLYCEKTFPSHAILRGHMRKKHHFRINPKNKQWDAFYLVNYRELGRTWDPHHDNADLESAGSGDERGADDQWEDWGENNSATDDTYCLFCTVSASDPHDIMGHMADAHAFTFQDLDFYQRVKAVNYLRWQAHLLRCGFCDQQFETKPLLMHHLESGDTHSRLPEDSIAWDQPQFFFPTFENDPLLTALEGPAEVGENAIT